MSDTTKRNPKIFISYSHDSARHSDRVLELSNQLRKHGLDCEIDQYIENPPKGWPNWMLDQMEAADFILVVCTETYYRRFRGRESGATGKGVTWEGAIVTQELYDAKGRNEKFVPVVFTASDTEYIPPILRGANHYEQTTQDGFEKLYRRLTGQHDTPKPELGDIQSLPQKARLARFDTLVQHEKRSNKGKNVKRWRYYVAGISTVLLLGLATMSVITLLKETSQPTVNSNKSAGNPDFGTGNGDRVQLAKHDEDMTNQHKIISAAESDAKTTNRDFEQHRPPTKARCEGTPSPTWTPEGKSIRVGSRLWLKDAESHPYRNIVSLKQVANEALDARDPQWRLPTMAELEELWPLICEGVLLHAPGDVIWSSDAKRLWASAMRYDVTPPMQPVEQMKDERAYVRLVRNVNQEN